MTYKIFLITLLSLILLPTSYASTGYPGISLNTAHTFLSTERQDEFNAVGRAKISGNGGTAKLTYGFDFGLFAGLAHSYGNGTNDSKRQYGPSLGYNYNGFSIGLNYFLNPEYQSTDVITYTDGNAYSIELAYHFKFATYFVLGANLTYSSEIYDSVEAGGTKVSAKYINNSFTPLISIGFNYDFLGGGELYYE